VFKCEEERQQQLRERARRLIAEARMGVVGAHTPQADQGSGPSKLTLRVPSSDVSSIAIQNTLVVSLKVSCTVRCLECCVVCTAYVFYRSCWWKFTDGNQEF
jgi:hypothetical protein